VSLQKSRLFPKVHLSGSYATDSKDAPFGSGGEGYVVGVGLRWEFFDKTLHDDIQRSRLEQMRSAEYLAQKKKEIGFQVHESYRKVTETTKRVEVARDAVEQARESLRLIQLRYQNGLSTLVELLDAQVALTSAETNLIVAGTDFQEAAAKALFTSGTLLVTLQPWLERNGIPNPKHRTLNDGRDDK
jgi:outer membrane protein TolC